MTTNALYVPAKFKTMLENMNLLDRFLFNETVEDPEVYRMIVVSQKGVDSIKPRLM